jgi:hypothetical protein
MTHRGWDIYIDHSKIGYQHHHDHGARANRCSFHNQDLSLGPWSYQNLALYRKIVNRQILGLTNTTCKIFMDDETDSNKLSQTAEIGPNA